jgi:holliday junction DNA helicase RuvA
MIASLSGIVRHSAENAVILDVGGVGLSIQVPRGVAESCPAVGAPFFLYTEFVVREESLALYGFTSLDQRQLFQHLLQVSGVGPRLALTLLSHLSDEVLRAAVGNNQPEVLARVPGIGRKTAEKLIFHLKDRLGQVVELPRPLVSADAEVLAVLTGLGYSTGEAQAAIQTIPSDAAEDVEARVRLALQHFMR